ncbi:hypothetical protein C8Q77DRAFT_9020 [Trametes polyzona]|nr:hypothetical protein C8Q77DRAFT_9020 [Trametes polyzona]
MVVVVAHKKRVGQSAVSSTVKCPQSAVSSTVESPAARKVNNGEKNPMNPLHLRAPPFPRPGLRAAKQFVAGGKTRVVVFRGKCGAPRRRSFYPTMCRPQIVYSAEGTKREGTETKAPHIDTDTRSRYEQRDKFEAGDHVCARDLSFLPDDDTRLGHIWRHGVIANLEQYPPRAINAALSLWSWPVDYEEVKSGVKHTQMKYFSTLRGGLLYDKVASAVASA